MQGASPPDSPATPVASQGPVAALLARRSWLVGLLAAVVAVTGWAALVTPLGEVSGHYTDHLRHMGEALAILQSGFEPYRLPYAEATAHLELPCPAHAGFWGEQVSLYPPLGLLLHAPVALLERAALGPYERDHAHFGKGENTSALNNDGTWKHNPQSLTQAIKEWLTSHGWSFPE